MAAKAVCVLKSEKVNGVVSFVQEVRTNKFAFFLIASYGELNCHKTTDRSRVS